MATKEVIIADSSSGIVLVLLVVLAFGAFIAYQQGMFSDKKDFEINLPGGKAISGSVSE